MKLNQLRQIIREELKGGPSSDRMYNQILAKGVEGGSIMPKTLIIPKKNTNQRLSFSLAGFKKLILKPTKMPKASDV